MAHEHGAEVPEDQTASRRSSTRRAACSQDGERPSPAKSTDARAEERALLRPRGHARRRSWRVCHRAGPRRWPKDAPWRVVLPAPLARLPLGAAALAVRRVAVHADVDPLAELRVARRTRSLLRRHLGAFDGVHDGPHHPPGARGTARGWALARGRPRPPRGSKGRRCGAVRPRTSPQRPAIILPSGRRAATASTRTSRRPEPREIGNVPGGVRLQ